MLFVVFSIQKSTSVRKNNITQLYFSIGLNAFEIFMTFRTSNTLVTYEYSFIRYYDILYFSINLHYH